MVQSLVVLTERALSAADAERLVALHDPDSPRFQVLVPAGGRRNVLVDVLDHLSLLQLREAFEAVQGHVERTPAQAEAAVRASVAELTRLGCEASGEVVTQDPVAALDADRLAQLDADGRMLRLDQALDLARRLASDSVGPMVAGPAAELTAREMEVAGLLAGGYRNRQIAEALVITEKTAANHVQRVLDKLGVTSRAQVAARAAELGLSRYKR